MTREQEQFLQDHLKEFTAELDGQPPNEMDWLNRVRECALENENPLRIMTAVQRDEVGRQIFRNLEILQVESADTSTKARDAEANLNNRRYVNGTF
jgi:hypothetical protein